MSVLPRVLALLAVLGLSACQHMSSVPERGGVIQEEVRFQAGDVWLVADLFMPTGPIAREGAVIIQGSGDSDRGNRWARGIAEGLAQRGLAVLLPDKRGSGASGGDWRTASFEQLADDAIAGVRLLRSRGVQRVGVVGLSQGGHIAPLAAARDPHVAFVAALSASIVPIAEQARDEVLQAARRMQIPAAQVKELRSLFQHLERYARTGKGWSSYTAVLERAKQGPLRGRGLIEPFPQDREHWLWTWARAVGQYDPLPFWRELERPGLIVLGLQDSQIDVTKSLRRWQEAMATKKRPQQVLILAGSGHALEGSGADGFHPDVLDAVARLGKRAAASVSPVDR